MSTPPARRSRLEVEDQGDIAIVTFIDRKILDEQNIMKIGEDLFSLVSVYGRKKILLNFDGVEYLSSVCLGKFITLNKMVQAAGGKLVMCSIEPKIFETFEMTRLDRLFNIQSDLPGGISVF